MKEQKEHCQIKNKRIYLAMIQHFAVFKTGNVFKLYSKTK